MKNLIKRILLILGSWTFCTVFNFTMAVIFLCAAIIGFNIACGVGAVVHLAIGLMAMILKIETRRREECEFAVILAYEKWIHAHNRVVIYKRHFGDLTPEMEEELRVEELKASQKEMDEEKE